MHNTGKRTSYVYDMQQNNEKETTQCAVFLYVHMFTFFFFHLFSLEKNGSITNSCFFFSFTILIRQKREKSKGVLLTTYKRRWSVNNFIPLEKHVVFMLMSSLPYSRNMTENCTYNNNSRINQAFSKKKVENYALLFFVVSNQRLS